MLHWGLTAAALLLLIYAVRTLFLSNRGAGNQGQERLGCGFALVATALWVYVLKHHLDDPWRAIRLGLGLLLVLPSVRAIARPRGAPILAAALGLVLAVVIAGPVMRSLWAEHGPDLRSAEERELAERIEEFEELRGEYAERLAGLAELHGQVKAEIRARSSRWEEVLADPELLGRVELLRRIEQETTAARTALATIDGRLPELRVALERLVGKETAAPPSGRSELDELLLEFQAAPPIDELPVVEQHLLKQELEELFEREF